MQYYGFSLEILAVEKNLQIILKSIFSSHSNLKMLHMHHINLISWVNIALISLAIIPKVLWGNSGGSSDSIEREQCPRSCFYFLWSRFSPHATSANSNLYLLAGVDGGGSIAFRFVSFRIADNLSVSRVSEAFARWPDRFYSDSDSVSYFGLRFDGLAAYVTAIAHWRASEAKFRFLGV